MPAAYDTYDYPSYWDSRVYEHNSEIIALTDLLDKIKNVNTILDVGAGYGRLTNIYINKGKKIILSDPSNKLLSLARRRITSDKVKFIQSKLENITNKIKPGTIDLIIMIRVLHHMADLDNAIRVLSGMIRDGGYLILEFPNKTNLKAKILEFIKGNYTFSWDIFSKDLRSKKSIKNNSLPFYNYHPDIIFEKLADNNFKIMKVLSVSNLRYSYLKRITPIFILLIMEKIMQKLFSGKYFGPSLFLLAKKRG